MLIVLILAAIAIHRIYNYEDIFSPLRRKLAFLPYPFSKIAGCPACNGVWIGLGVAGISVAPYADIVLTGLALYPAVRGLVWVYGNIGRIQASRSETSPSAPLKAVVAPPPDDPKTCADMEKQGLESPCSAKKRKLQETIDIFRAYEKRFVIMTALHNFDPSYSLTSVILNQALALATANPKWGIVLLVMTTCKDPDIALPENILIRKAIPPVPFREDEVHEGSVRILSKAIRGQLMTLGNATVITHDLLFVSQFLTFAAAIHEIGNIPGFAWYHTCHSAPGKRNSNEKTFFRYNLPEGHHLLALTDYQAKGLKAYYDSQEDPAVVPNIRDVRTYPHLMEKPLFDFVTKHKLIEADITQVYPVSTTRFAAKGLDTLIRIFGELSKTKKVRLVVVNPHANGNDAASIIRHYRRIANRAGLADADLVFASEAFPDKAAVGLPADWVSALYRCSNIFIFPSWSEACPLILQEAVLHRLPIVVNKDAPMLPALLPGVPAVSLGNHAHRLTDAEDQEAVRVILDVMDKNGEKEKRDDLRKFSLETIGIRLTALTQ